MKSCLPDAGLLTMLIGVEIVANTASARAIPVNWRIAEFYL
jgi:hypothetical protein